MQMQHPIPVPPTAGPSKGYIDAIPPEEAYVSLDCEFVGIISGAEHALAQVSVCDFHGSVIYSSYCSSDAPVVDYRSWVSGVRPEDLVNAPSFASVQEKVRDVIKDKILVGHALHNDLAVLAIDHPQHMIRDTAFYRPLQLLVHSDRPSLRALAKVVLNKDVQTGEHGATTDAQITMEVFKVHRTAWEATLLAGLNPIVNPMATSPINSFHSISSSFPTPQAPFSPPGPVPPTPFAPVPFQQVPSPFPTPFMQAPPGLGTPFKPSSADPARASPPVQSRFSAAYSALPPRTTSAAASQPPQNLAALELLQALQQKKQQLNPNVFPSSIASNSSNARVWQNLSQNAEGTTPPASNYARSRQTSVPVHATSASPTPRSRGALDKRRSNSQSASPKKLTRGVIKVPAEAQWQQRDPSPASSVSGSQLSDHSSLQESDSFFHPSARSRPFLTNSLAGNGIGVAASTTTTPDQSPNGSPRDRGNVRGSRRLRVLPLRDSDSSVVPIAA